MPKLNLRSALLLVAFIGAEAALLSLANWQLHRYHQRVNEQIAAQNAPPIELTGTYGPELAALTQQPDPTMPEDSGWRLYGVLNTPHGSVLINRGYHAPQWVDRNESTPNFIGLTAPSGTLTLKGVWALTPTRKGLLHGPDITTHPQLLAFLNPSLITSATLAPQQLVLTVPEMAGSPLTPAAPPLANPLRHLSYAIQWLCMAATLLIMAGFAWRKSVQQSNRQPKV